jgi:hypothetical protein
MITPGLELTHGSSISCDGQHRAGGEVNADADDLMARDMACGKRSGDSLVQDFEVVTWRLESGVWSKCDVAEWQSFVDDPVRVTNLLNGDLFTCGEVQQEHAPGLSSKVHADADSPRGPDVRGAQRPLPDLLGIATSRGEVISCCRALENRLR